MTNFTINFDSTLRTFATLADGANSGLGSFKTRAAAARAIRRSGADLDEIEGVDFTIS